MKAYIVLLRNGTNITRRFVSAESIDLARTVAVNRFGGVVINVLLA